MFNKGKLEQSQYSYENAINEVKQEQKNIVKRAQRLYSAKKELLGQLENNMILKSQITTVDNILRLSGLNMEIQSFKVVEKLAESEIQKDFHQEDNSVDNKKRSSATSGMVAGMATAAAGAAAPSALVALTTTFGVASTGTAISTLSGAALTNATMAAIGGGTMAAGSTIMSLLGPIGLILGGSIAGFTMLRTSSKNKVVAEQYDSETFKIQRQIDKQKNIIANIQRLNDKILDTTAMIKMRQTWKLPVNDQLDTLRTGAKLLNTKVGDE